MLHEIPEDLHVGQREGAGQPGAEPHHHHAQDQGGLQQDLRHQRPGHQGHHCHQKVDLKYDI